MEYLQHHSKEIITLLQSRIQDKQSIYLLFDLPGQVELFTHSTCIQSFFHSLTKTLDARLCLIQLLDSHFCLGNPERYISGVLSCMSSMVRLELPTVNVLSKMDLLRGRNEEDLALGMEFFLDCYDVNRLLPFLHSSRKEDSAIAFDDVENDKEYQNAIQYKTKSRFYEKYNKLHQALCEVIDDFSLVSFIPLDINDVESVSRVAARVDKANGFVFVSDYRINEMDNSMFTCAIENDTDWKFEVLADVQERIGDVHAEEIQELKCLKE